MSSDRFLEEFAQAAEAETPPPSPSRSSSTVLGKHPRSDESTESDSEDGNRTPTPPVASGSLRSGANKNYVEYAKKLALEKKLRGDQTSELVAFTEASPIAREIKLFAQLLAIERKQDSLVANKPPWEPSHGLTINIRSYSLGVLLSSRLPTYKGDVPKNHVAAIIKRLRFDLPPNIDRDVASWRKVIKVIQNELTEHRSAIKKLLRDSIKNNTSIYELARQLCEGSECTVSVPLCARIALMRKGFVANAARDFWDDINKDLASMRAIAKGSEKAIQKIFISVLEKDRKKYGVSADEDSEVPEFVPEWQEEIDNSIAGLAN